MKMTHMAKNLDTIGFFQLFIVLLITTDLAILLDIPFLRQNVGFLFLTILPGLLILQTLKLNKIDFLERIILAWRVSISFLMFFGLFINNLLPSLGYATPLSTISLLISFNIAIITSGYNVKYAPIETPWRVGTSKIKPFRDGFRYCLSIL